MPLRVFSQRPGPDAKPWLLHKWSNNSWLFSTSTRVWNVTLTPDRHIVPKAAMQNRRVHEAAEPVESRFVPFSGESVNPLFSGCNHRKASSTGSACPVASDLGDFTTRATQVLQETADQDRH